MMGVEVLIVLTLLRYRAPPDPPCSSGCWPRQHEESTIKSLDLAPVRLPTSAAEMRLSFLSSARAHGCWCWPLAALSAEGGALARWVQACRGLAEPLASRRPCTVRCPLLAENEGEARTPEADGWGSSSSESVNDASLRLSFSAKLVVDRVGRVKQRPPMSRFYQRRAAGCDEEHSRSLRERFGTRRSSVKRPARWLRPNQRGEGQSGRGIPCRVWRATAVMRGQAVSISSPWE